MTPWEYSVAMIGWANYNIPDENRKSEKSYPTEKEFEDAILRLN